MVETEAQNQVGIGKESVGDPRIDELEEDRRVQSDASSPSGIEVRVAGRTWTDGSFVNAAISKVA